MVTVLGIESSCDETAAAIVDGDGRILAERLFSQIALHQPYGGVVPEIAARAHVSHLDRLIRAVLDDSGLDLDHIDAFAATTGPGLIGGLIVGSVTARMLALLARRPFLAINHLEGHALSARLGTRLAFPYLLLLISGGHCQLLTVTGVGRYHRLGTTIDDAVGEAFDKTAALLGLPYPGGPALEALAAVGDPAAIALPRPMLGRAGADFSFSGLKTAVRQRIQAEERRLSPTDRSPTLSARFRADLAASFQAAISDCLADRTERAIAQFRAEHPTGGALVAAGGVAANRRIGDRLRQVAATHGLDCIIPPPARCTDNGAMIAWAGIERLRLGLTQALDGTVRPRWPLDPDATPAPFAGVKA